MEKRPACQAVKFPSVRTYSMAEGSGSLLTPEVRFRSASMASTDETIQTAGPDPGKREARPSGLTLQDRLVDHADRLARARDERSRADEPARFVATVRDLAIVSQRTLALLDRKDCPETASQVKRLVGRSACLKRQIA